MKEKEIDAFEKVETQLSGLYEEVLTLVKKSPDGGINKFKLKHINTVLDAANSILKATERPFKDFAQFSEDDLPTNSDVLFILRQYANCLEEVRAANIEEADGKWYWRIGSTVSDRRARPPAKLNPK